MPPYATTPQQLLTDEEFEQFRELFERVRSVIPAFREQAELDGAFEERYHWFSDIYDYPGIHSVQHDGLTLGEFDIHDGEFKEGLIFPKEAFIHPAEYEMKIKRQNAERKEKLGLAQAERRRAEYERLKAEFEPNS